MKKFLYILSIFILFSSCSKFEDGPKFSLLPQKMRLKGNWQIEKVFDITSNESIIANYYKLEIELKKDETYSKKISYNNDIFIENGTWKMNQDSILFNHTEYNINYLEKFKILRLTNSELWITNNSKEFHYKKQK